MAANLTPGDRIILKMLVKSGRVSEEQAQKLAEILVRQKAKDPTRGIADLLVTRDVVTTTEMNKLLWEADKRTSAAELQAKAEAMEEHADEEEDEGEEEEAPVRRPRRATAVAPAAKSNIGLWIALGVAFWGLAGGIGAFVYMQQNNDPQEVASGDNDPSDRDPADQGNPVPSSARVDEGRSTSEFDQDDSAYEEVRRPSSDDRDDEGAADDDKLSYRQAEKRLVDALRETTPRERLGSLAALVERSPDSFVAEVQEELDNQLERFEALAEAEWKRIQSKLERAKSQMQLAKAYDLCFPIYDRFGPLVLEGKLKSEVDSIAKQRKKLWEENLAEATKAFDDENYELARRIFERTHTYGTSGQVAESEKWLAKIEKVADTAAPLVSEEELAAIRKREKEKGRRPSDDDESEADEVEPPETDEWATELGQRLKPISDRLSDLFSATESSLSADGTIQLTYEFTSKDLALADDWLPKVKEVPDTRDKIRWSVDWEERNGLKLANDGVFLMEAPVLGDVEFEAEIYVGNPYNQRNLFALCWADKKGKGAAGIYGRQVATLKKFRPGKRKPSKPKPVLSDKDYTYKLMIVEGEFRTALGNKKSDTIKLPKKLESGHCGFVWSGSIAVIVQRVKVKAKLDIEWAEKQLGFQ